jgi:DNA-binding SARP family transcriptional activator
MTASMTLQAGLEAFQQARYLEAISLLEAFCQSCSISEQDNSRDHWRAQMYLIETYQRAGCLEQAEQLCQQLSQCPNAQVQIWAQQKVQKLVQSAEIAPETSPAEADADCPSLTQRAKQLLSTLVRR